MRYPKPLDTDTMRNRILVAATSRGVGDGVYKKRLDEGVFKLEAAGYKVEVDPMARGNELPVLADTPRNIGKRFMERWATKDSDLVIAAAGGELMCEAMDHMDLEKLAYLVPKWFMGFSDNTNLAFLLPTACDVAAVYGPCICEYAMEPWHQVLKAALRATSTAKGGTYVVSGYQLHQGEKIRSEENPFADYNVSVPNVLSYANASKENGCTFTGRAIGGCLDVLALYPGTAFDRMASFNKKYAKDGVIWMLEACDMNVFDVRRTLWQLDHAGWFDSATGFVFGRLPQDNEVEGFTYQDAIEGALGYKKLPMVWNCDLGHIPPSMPFIEGAWTTVSAKGDRIKLTQRLV